MKDLIFSAPINSLSFGNVSYNFLREFHRMGLNLKFFPIGKDLDFSAFDKTEDDFKKWVVDGYNNRLRGISKSMPYLKMWHLNGSEAGMGDRRFLYTFHETDTPTEEEENIASMQTGTIFSSSFSRDTFSKKCENCTNSPLGFDEDFHETNKKYLSGKVHFGLMGKWEKRKHTASIISKWAKKFGNNPEYQLSCCVGNPFLQEDQFREGIQKALNGEKYKNINFLPRLKTNSEVNEFLNSIDIDLSGLSGAEGWNLPAFNATCLGKWSVVLNATSHKDWANKDNCILVEPEGLEPCYDELFFKEGNAFNQGNINTFSDSSFDRAISDALTKVGSYNKTGSALRQDFTYTSTVNNILNIISK